VVTLADKAAGKARYIAAYFEHLQKRIAFLTELYGMGRKDEALLLCCCYIEALGSRRSGEARKAKNYCTILIEEGENPIWGLVHPAQLKDVLADNGLFRSRLEILEPLIDKFGPQLVTPAEVRARLEPSLNAPQQAWFNDCLFKATLANISYERIRSELVHDISGTAISFSKTSYNGEPVPDVDFEMLYASLRAIADKSQKLAVSTNKWWFEKQSG
jgi:hypothetical protein